MIKKFNQYETINEKFGMEYAIPLLISMGLVNPSQAQDITPNQIETIINDNPEVSDTIKNKMVIKESLNQLKELEQALMFLNSQDDFKEETLKKNLEVSKMDPNIQQKLMGIISGSGVFQVPKFGTFANMVINLDKDNSVSIGTGPFGKTLSYKKTIDWKK